MEAIGYMLAYFLRGGELPWMRLAARRLVEKYEQIKCVKEETSFEELFAGQPKEFIKYLTYCRELKFD